MKFHEIKVCCPSCSKEATVTSMYFSTAGMMRIECICVLCGKKLESYLSWEDTVIHAAQQETIQLAVAPVVTTMQ